MGRRKIRMFKSTNDKEAKFIACLLANGPPPPLPSMTNYKQEVMDWWRAGHQSLPAISDKGVHRFYNRYKRWLANERYRQRKPAIGYDS